MDDIIKDLEEVADHKNATANEIFIVETAIEAIKKRDNRIKELETDIDKLYDAVIVKLDNVDKIIKEGRNG